MKKLVFVFAVIVLVFGGFGMVPAVQANCNLDPCESLNDPNFCYGGWTSVWKFWGWGSGGRYEYYGIFDVCESTGVEIQTHFVTCLASEPGFIPPLPPLCPEPTPV